MSIISTVHALPRELAYDAETVTVYRMDGGPRAGMTVVEITNVHGTVLARTITDAAGSRGEVADLVLAQSPIERCNAWAVHPIGNGKRITATLAPGVSGNPGTLSTVAAQHGYRTANA